MQDIQKTLDKNIQLKPGYYFEYGGQFENLQNAINTLLVVVPVALMLILLLLFFAFKNVTYTLVVFSTVPLSLIGGILALWLRGLPFSISAGVGFIALFGVAVLNGILMINHFNDIRKETMYALSTRRVIARGTAHLLRPVFLTGLVASLGFVPMAIATSAGAEVQRPLATVVIGGLIVSTVLTLLIIPVFYQIVSYTVVWKRRFSAKKFLFFFLLLAVVSPFTAKAQEKVTMDQAIELAKQNHPRLKIASAAIRQVKAGRGEVLELSSTEMNYSWGQLNGELRKDKQWEVTQGLGSLLTPFYKNALVNRQVEMGAFYRQVVEKEVVAEVKRAWAYYLYACNLRALYNDQNKLAEQLQRMGELRYHQGEITLLEKNMTTSMAADMKNRLFQAQEEEKLALSRLNWVCYADRPLVPVDTALVQFPVDYQAPSFSEVHMNYFQSQANEAKAQLNVERSRFFPELSFGYVRQDILPLKGLNSWMVGVSFPVYFLPRRSKIKQAKVAAVIARTEAETNTQNLYNKVSEAVASLRRQSESLRYYTTSALKEADELLKVANLQLQHSETNITEFIQAVNVARDIRRGYLETVYQYNIAALEYELFK